MQKAPKYKIGVFGSAVAGSPAITRKAEAIGTELAKRNTIVITGGCSGSPYAAASAAAKRGAEIWGFSPELNLGEHKKCYRADDSSIYKKLIFIPKNFTLRANSMARKKYRNVISTATSDAGIIISGRWGTLNEITNLRDMNKVIGVLTNTGGISDELKQLNKKLQKPGSPTFLYSASPAGLVKMIIKELKRRRKNA